MIEVEQDVSAEVAELRGLAVEVRRNTLRLITEAHYGFIGSCFSCLDLIVCLGWSKVSRCFASTAEHGANLVLSKGHAAAVLYAALMEYDEVSHDGKYAAFGSPLQAHPNSLLYPRVMVSSGSLGQGVPVAVGLALAERLRGRAASTYVLVGDGEMQTGVVWESLMAAARQRSIPKLVVLVDANGFQSVGRVDKLDVTSAMLQAVASVFIEIDGHDIVQILDALAHCSVSDGLSVIWARTKRGAGLAGFDEAWPMSSLAEPELVAAWLAALGG